MDLVSDLLKYLVNEVLSSDAEFDVLTSFKCSIYKHILSAWLDTF